jgi:hypothetical protein
VIGQKFQKFRLLMISKAVKLYPTRVVDVEVLFLSDCIHLLIVKKLNIPNHLLGLEFADEILSLPLQKR